MSGRGEHSEAPEVRIRDQFNQIETNDARTLPNAVQ